MKKTEVEGNMETQSECENMVMMQNGAECM